MTFQFRNFADSFQNLLSGLGVFGRDKIMSQIAIMETLTNDQAQLEALYRSDWLARKIIEVPAFDSTRAWRTWDADENQIKKLEECERALGLQRKIMDALVKARLYGGAALLIGIKGQDFTKELDVDSIKKGDLLFVHVVEKWMMQAGPRVRDILSPWFGEPEYYSRTNTPIIGAPGNVEKLPTYKIPGKPSDVIYIHPSRVVRLVGLDYPDLEKAPDVWGDSVLQPVADALRNAGSVVGSMANLTTDCKVDVFRIPGLTSTLSTMDGTNKLVSYLSNANVAKSVVNALVLDKEIEWERIKTTFEGMPQVLQSFLIICCAAADIPATRLLGREPTGMNATGESDIRNYYDKLHADQNVRLTPLLNRLDEVLIRHTLGTRPAEIAYEWNSLWQTSDGEKATIALQKAQAFKIDVDTGLLPPEALQQGRENQLIEDGFYPGFDSALDDAKKAMEKDDYDYEGDQPAAGNSPQSGGGQSPPQPSKPGGKPNGKGGGDDPAPSTSSKPGFEDAYSDAEVQWTKGEGGRFTGSMPGGGSQTPVGRISGAGAAPSATAGQRLSGWPGHGYSAQAKLRNDTIYTPNVRDATRALYEGRKVELNQPRAVSTLIEHLGAVAKKMDELGAKAPVFDLCKVSVSGTNLFCSDSKGIPRVKMPQLDDKQTKEFRQYLKDQGYAVTKTKELASHLRATQNELNGAKVAKIIGKLEKHPDEAQKRLVISKDNYILDGHHHWAAQIGLDAKNNKLGDIAMDVSRVNIGITTLLREADKFTGGKGHVGVGDRLSRRLHASQEMDDAL